MTTDAGTGRTAEAASPAAPMTLCVIGAGSMGSAIASGLVRAGVVEADRLSVCNPHEDKLEAFRALGARTFTDDGEALALGPDVVVLAVKPQVLPGVLEGLAAGLAGRLVISIAAGVSLDALERALPESRVVRAMPNLPLQAGLGATAISAGASATEEDLALALSLFRALGCAESMREDQLDAEGAVVGCGPAYFACFADALTRAGVRAGLPAATCREMVLTTMKGVAEQLLSSGVHPRAYMEAVTSPGGTTAEGLKEIEPHLVEGSYAAVEGALRRTAELAG